MTIDQIVENQKILTDYYKELHDHMYSKFNKESSMTINEILQALIEEKQLQELVYGHWTDIEDFNTYAYLANDAIFETSSVQLRIKPEAQPCPIAMQLCLEQLCRLSSANVISLHSYHDDVVSALEPVETK